MVTGNELDYSKSHEEPATQDEPKSPESETKTSEGTGLEDVAAQGVSRKPMGNDPVLELQDQLYSERPPRSKGTSFSSSLPMGLIFVVLACLASSLSAVYEAVVGSTFYWRMVVGSCLVYGMCGMFLGESFKRLCQSHTSKYTTCGR